MIFHRRDADSRSGVALVTVLGILGTLTLLALAFTLLTRTERAAAHNALARSDARHYIDAALNFTLSDTLRFQTLAQGSMTYEELFDDCGLPKTDNDNNPVCGVYCHGFYGRDDGDTPSTRLGRNSLTNWLPRATWDEATNTWSFWQPIIATNRSESSSSVTNGRISYLVIDCSGFLDVHGVTTNHAVALARLDFKPDVDFSVLRDEDGTNRYSFLSQPDFNSRGGAWGFAAPASNLVTCLFDPGPDCTITNWTNLGERDVELVPKYDLCPWDADELDAHPSCLDLYHPDVTLSEWLDEVTNRLAVCGYEGEEGLAIAWNLLNFIDRDRIPQAWDSNGNELAAPWRNDWPVEDVPLINGFQAIEESWETNAVEAVEEWYKDPASQDADNRHISLSPESWTNYSYRVATSLWYPFAPRPVEEEDRAALVLCVYTNSIHVPAEGDFDDEDLFPLDATGGIAGIRFGGEDDDDKDELRDLVFDLEDETTLLQVFTNPAPATATSSAGITFPVLAAITNTWVETIPNDPLDPEAGTHEETNVYFECVEQYLPLGTGQYLRFVGHTTNEPPVLTDYENTLRPLARVSIGENTYTNWVDEAPGYAELPVFDGATNHWLLTIDDPRQNGDSAKWRWVEEEDWTPAETNAECTAWKAGEPGDTRDPGSQGLPLLHFDGPLRVAGDIGHIATTGAWQSVSLLDTSWMDDNNQYAVFTHGSVLDFFTVRKSNRPTCGLMAYSTPWTNVIRAVMCDIPISESRSSTNLVSAIEAEDGENLVDWMTECFIEAREQYISTDEGESDTHVCPTTIGELAYFIGELPIFREGPDEYWGDFASSDLWQPATNRLDDVLKEDIIRGLAERISFRQRLYVIVLAAQSLAPNGRIAADQRAVVTVASDLFTGDWRILNWAWLE